MSHRRKKCREEAAGAVVAGPASRPPTSLSGKPPLLRQSLGNGAGPRGPISYSCSSEVLPRTLPNEFLI